MHYVIIIAVISYIVIRQLSVFGDTKRKIQIFRGIFSSEKDNYEYGANRQIEKAILNAGDEELKMMLKNADSTLMTITLLMKMTTVLNLLCLIELLQKNSCWRM